jgi:hypothetical protein
MWAEIAYGTGIFVGGAGVGWLAAWYAAHAWYRSAPDHVAAIRNELERVVNVEQVEYNAHQRRVEMMRAGVKTQRLEPNPKDPAVVRRMRIRRRPVHLPEADNFDPEKV